MPNDTETHTELSSQTDRESAGVSCPACGYDLTGLTVDRCPECGLDEAAQPATAHRLRVQRNQRYKRIAVTVAVGLVLLGALLDPIVAAVIHSPDSSAAGRICGFAAAYAAVVWCQCDAVVQGRRVGKGTLVLVFLFAPVALLVYLANQRRRRSVLKLVGLGILLIAGVVVVTLVEFRIMYGYWDVSL